MDRADLNEFVSEMIHSLRGGEPTHCDFCTEPFDERGAVPDEAGEWACYRCWDRWEPTHLPPQPQPPAEHEHSAPSDETKP